MRQVIRRQWTLMLAACMATLLGVVLMGCSSGGNQPSSVDSVDSQVQTSQVEDPEVAADETDNTQGQNSESEDSSSETAVSEPAAAGVTIDNFSFTLDENNICTATATVTNHDSYMHNVVLLDEITVLAEETDNYGDPVEKEYTLRANTGDGGAFFVLNDSFSESDSKTLAFWEIDQAYIYDLQENEAREIAIVIIPSLDFDGPTDEYNHLIKAIPTTAIISATCIADPENVLSPSQYELNTTVEDVDGLQVLKGSVINQTDYKWKNATINYVQAEASGTLTLTDFDARPITDWMRVEYVKPRDTAECEAQGTLYGTATQIVVLWVEYEPENS